MKGAIATNLRYEETKPIIQPSWLCGTATATAPTAITAQADAESSHAAHQDDTVCRLNRGSQVCNVNAQQKVSNVKLPTNVKPRARDSAAAAPKHASIPEA
jgi:hypothetical protein